MSSKLIASSTAMPAPRDKRFTNSRPRWSQASCEHTPHRLATFQPQRQQLLQLLLVSTHEVLLILIVSPRQQGDDPGQHQQTHDQAPRITPAEFLVVLWVSTVVPLPDLLQPLLVLLRDVTPRSAAGHAFVYVRGVACLRAQLAHPFGLLAFGLCRNMVSNSSRPSLAMAPKPVRMHETASAAETTQAAPL
eukprot:CAMPEP_0183554606 /NCGR_PEP_ID=MMETSP0371-20130417/78947_1 /TAXON_ID=268820 /ORGANISM="Peridinium aciculiferum, Strain PAER-2" /LENGTH=190 /DNA_ID=CAMNT_0025760561 /DNA_START=13 /DNA_END=582 /DNA_ORIENTATION=+